MQQGAARCGPRCRTRSGSAGPTHHSSSAAPTDLMPGRWLVSAGLLAPVLAAALLYSAFQIDGPHVEPTTVVVAPGTSLNGIAARLESAGVIRSAMLFEAGLRLTGVGRRLQAGEYAYPARASMWQVADAMARGQSVLHRITLVEGITVREAVA
ncbi:MAG: endolytic transglycosylase MltG, partial [Rhodospirillales bacterium]|nr:endolytic transglycosylase MltG [Rhodospirillales bacterium]